MGFEDSFVLEVVELNLVLTRMLYTTPRINTSLTAYDDVLVPRARTRIRSASLRASAIRLVDSESRV